MIRVFAIFVFALATLAIVGCGNLFDVDPSKLAKAPPLPADFQGDWTFDEAATLAHWKQAMSPADFKVVTEMQELVRSKTGRPLHTDLNINGSVLTGRNAAVLPVYRLIDWKKDNALFAANAMVWEDSRDKHDVAFVSIKLQTQSSNKVLWLDVADHESFDMSDDEQQEEDEDDPPASAQHDTSKPTPSPAEPTMMRFIFTRVGPPPAKPAGNPQ